MERAEDRLRALEWSRLLEQQGYVDIRLGRWRRSTLRVDRTGITTPDTTVPWTEVAEVVAARARVVVATPDRTVTLPRGADATLAEWLESRVDAHVELAEAPQLLIGAGDTEDEIVCQDQTLRWIALDRLGLSDDLLDALRDWNRRTRSNLDSPAPMEERVEVWESLVPEGRAIAARMEAELPPGSRVRLLDDTL